MLELKDIVSLTLGSAGFTISIVNLTRAVGSDRRTRELAFATEKKNVLVMLREEELSSEAKVLRLENIITSAHSVKAEMLIEEAEKFKEQFQSQEATISTLRVGFDRYPSRSAEHSDLVSMHEGTIPKLRRFQAERLQKDLPFEVFFVEAKETIENFRKVWRLELTPTKRSNTSIARTTFGLLARPLCMSKR